LPVRADARGYIYLLCIRHEHHWWASAVADLRQFVRIHPDLEWQQVLDKAERQVRCDLLLGLELARQSMETPLQAMIHGQLPPILAGDGAWIVRRYGITTDAPLVTREKFAFEGPGSASGRGGSDSSSSSPCCRTWPTGLAGTCSGRLFPIIRCTLPAHF
jgi:hypothetical protein